MPSITVRVAPPNRRSVSRDWPHAPITSRSAPTSAVCESRAVPTSPDDQATVAFAVVPWRAS